MDEIAHFIRARHIDSFQKIRLLILLHRYPESAWTSQQIAERLYLSDVPLLEQIITDLQEEGLVDYVGNRYTLCAEPGIQSGLQRLARACENPLARQQILDQMAHGMSLISRYQEHAHESY